MTKKKRIVVVGTGSIGKRHARLLSERADISVELCDPNILTLNEAIQELGNLPKHLSFERMLKTKPDMLLIASPHKFHVQQTIQGLNIGAHVLCEKPMSDSLNSAKKILKVTTAANQILSYGFSNHFHPGILKIKKLIASGQLGEVLYAHFHVGTYGTLVNSLSRYQSKVDSAILMDYVHQPDLLYWILAKNPSGVYAAAGTGVNLDLLSSPNALTLVLDYDSGLTSSIHLNYLQYPDRYHYEFIGDKGWIYLDLISNSITVGDRKKNITTQEHLKFDRDCLYISEHQAFFDAISGKRLPESPAEEAFQSMIVLEAAIQSWKTKKRVTTKQFYS